MTNNTEKTDYVAKASPVTLVLGNIFMYYFEIKGW